MSGGAPIPELVGKDESPKDPKILCIADLEIEGSKKLPVVARGEKFFRLPLLECTTIFFFVLYISPIRVQFDFMHYSSAE